MITLSVDDQQEVTSLMKKKKELSQKTKSLNNACSTPTFVIQDIRLY